MVEVRVLFFQPKLGNPFLYVLSDFVHGSIVMLKQVFPKKVGNTTSSKISLYAEALRFPLTRCKGPEEKSIKKRPMIHKRGKECPYTSAVDDTHSSASSMLVKVAQSRTKRDNNCQYSNILRLQFDQCFCFCRS